MHEMRESEVAAKLGESESGVGSSVESLQPGQ